MNPGGEPERDDTGLPPVDIEIPDDARELDRDVQAYYREQRASRRHERRLRLHRSLARDGIVLPLLACCLILALITGTLLTVFTATSDQNLPGVGGKSKPTTGPHSGGGEPAASSAASSPAASSPRAASRPPSHTASAAVSGPTPAGEVLHLQGLLPATTLLVDNQVPIQTSALKGAMLVLIPQSCNCAATLQWLADIGAQADTPTYLVDTPSTSAEVQGLDAQLAARHAGPADVAYDASGVLESRYPPHGVTALLVAPDQKVAYVDHLSSSRGNSADIVRALTG